MSQAAAPWTPALRRRGVDGEKDFDVSCFDEYDLHCEHPGVAYERSASADHARRAVKEDVFAGF